MSHSLKKETLKDASFVGATDLTDVNAGELSVLGPLKFHNLTVGGDSDVMGSIRESQNGTFNDLSVLGAFEAAHITCKTLDVAGSVKVTGLTVNGDANIVGSLEIKASTDPKFPNNLQNLDVSAEVVTLEDTLINGDITVQPTLKNKALKWLKQDTVQVLHLVGQTTVKGNISFVSGKGKIRKSPEVKIEGSVIGGEVEKD